jgi:hypothetical protein
MHHARSFLTLGILSLTTACASARSTSPATQDIGVSQLGAYVSSTNGIASPPREILCNDCGAIPMPTEITRAVESRITELKTRGGDCSRYGSVLETSYRGGRIILRPFMWRVGTHLASGEAKPNGSMTLAREIDSLNVGVRTVEDVVFSMEHEAVHITFDLASGIEASEVKANQYVQACKA